MGIDHLARGAPRIRCQQRKPRRVNAPPLKIDESRRVRGLIRLGTARPDCPSRGSQLLDVLRIAVESHDIGSIVIQISERGEDLPMGRRFPESGTVLVENTSILAYRIPREAMSWIAELYDDVSVRAYRLFSLLPEHARSFDTVASRTEFHHASVDELLIESKQHAGLSVFCDTDDGEFEVTMCPGEQADRLLARAVELGVATRRRTSPWPRKDLRARAVRRSDQNPS